ncbi:MAG: L-threonylcarbamoyladenylate synthase, partial [Candidatus Falkowbacteria bacterium]|nr:L-threonylcarbamoyladenylate synthase [Candidatus Falkowbacteria bacterium]
MKRIKINLKKVENQTVNLIASYFKKGKVVVYPTDTLYGLGCLATCQPAISKIYKLKGIKSPKPLIVLIKDFKMLHAFCQVNKTQEKYIRCFWPSTAGKKEEKKKLPTTFILRSRGRLPKEILGQGNSLAVRLPKNDFLTKILVQVQAPIISTSVNITGQS